MIKSKEVLHQALQALEYYRKNEDHEPTPASLTIGWLRQALAEWTPDDTAYRPDGLSQDIGFKTIFPLSPEEELEAHQQLEANLDGVYQRNNQAFLAQANLVKDELPPVKSYCGGKPNYCEPPPDQLPDTTKMIDKVCIRYWVQDTMESGRWATTDSISRSTAGILLSGVYGNTFERGEIVELPEMPVDSGAWSDVEDATKWVDELRGDDKQCSSCGGFCGEVCEREDVEPIAWNEGYPTNPYAKEWFIAETVFGDRVVLKSLAEENAYDFTTADRTYIKKETVKRWMQFPDSQYVPFSPAKPNPNDVVKPIGEIIEAHGLIAVSIPEMPPVGTKLYDQPLLNQTCCGCGRSGGYALYCGWCWSKFNKS